MLPLPQLPRRPLRPMPILLAFVTVSLFSLLPHATAASLTFSLPYGQRKCFAEDMPPSAWVRGTVHVSSGKGEMSLDLFVSDPRGTVYFHKSDVNSIKFSFHTGAFQPHTTQPYRFCVVNQVHPHAAHTPEVVRRVTLDITMLTEERKGEVDRLAKQEHVDKVYANFLQVSQSVDGLIEKMDELRAAEQLLTDLNEQTATTILRISLVACLFTIGAGVMNFFSLKTFFKRKKLA